MKVLVSIQQPVAAWQIPDAAVARLRDACPGHEFVHATTDQARAAALVDCDVAFTWVLSAAELATATRLAWVHSSAVAVGTLCLQELAARGIVVSNSRQIQSTPIAEHVFAMLLALTRRLPLAFARQQQATWAQNEFGAAQLPDVLRGQCLGIVGLGSIGAAVARLGVAFGMDVVGVRRDASLGGPPGVRQVWGSDDLDALVEVADVVVLAAPLTAGTAAMFDRARIARMRPGARLVNVARGPLVDSTALAEALVAGRLGGAALDVVHEEPLPSSHPLWAAPNLVLTPHTSGFRPNHWLDVADLFIDNLRRWEAGAPVRWVIDAARGY